MQADLPAQHNRILAARPPESSPKWRLGRVLVVCAATLRGVVLAPGYWVALYHVSRRQASLVTDGTRWFVENLGSANGTYVTRVDAPIPDDPISGRVEVSHHDRLRGGSFSPQPQYGPPRVQGSIYSPCVPRGQ